MILRRRRIWIETVRPSVWGRPDVLSTLASYGLEPLVAIRPWETGEAAAWVATMRGAGLRPGLWPMLSDADGRYAHAGNAASYAGFVGELVGDLAGDGATIALDLEPPFAVTRAILEHARRGSLVAFARAAADLARAIGRGDASMAPVAKVSRDLRARGFETLAALPPTVGIGGGAIGRAAGLLTATPFSPDDYDALSAMAYTSITEGALPFATRRFVAALLAFAASGMARYGPRGGLSLGAVGVGAFGVERTYRDPSELRGDVAIAGRAGIDDLSLFDLGGVLARPPAAAWLDAFTGAGGARGT